MIDKKLIIELSAFKNLLVQNKIKSKKLICY